MELEQFASEYEDLAYDVLGSGFQSFAPRLRDWIDLVDSSPVAPLLRELEGRTDFELWYAAGRGSGQGRVGSGRLAWSDDRITRLGQTLSVFRHIAANDMEFVEYSSTFLWAGNTYDDMVFKIASEVFQPFARDLLKYIHRNWEAGASSDKIPASDRVVTLDHNSAKYSELMDGLRELESRLSASNSLKQAMPDEADQRIAELSAGRRLLEAIRVRSEAAWNVIYPALRWVGEKAADHIVGLSVAAIVALLASLLGISVPGL